MTNKKPIIGYEDLYEIYDDGRVFGKISNRFLKPGIDSKGYYQVSLSKDGKGTSTRIHRLVAIHFIPNPDNKPCIDHKDRIKTNNSISNLQWCTHKENLCNQSLRSNKKNGAKYVGVYRIESRNKWVIYVKINGKNKYIGCFDDEEEGYKARKEYIQKNLPELYKFYYPD